MLKKQNQYTEEILNTFTKSQKKFIERFAKRENVSMREVIRHAVDNLQAGKEYRKLVDFLLKNIERQSSRVPGPGIITNLDKLEKLLISKKK